jgi:hypothetical protein
MIAGRNWFCVKVTTRRRDRTLDKIDKRSRYSPHGESWCVTSDNFLITN